MMSLLAKRTIIIGILKYADDKTKKQEFINKLILVHKYGIF